MTKAVTESKGPTPKKSDLRKQSEDLTNQMSNLNKSKVFLPKGKKDDNSELSIAAAVKTSVPEPIPEVASTSVKMKVGGKYFKPKGGKVELTSQPKEEEKLEATQPSKEVLSNSVNQPAPIAAPVKTEE